MSKHWFHRGCCSSSEVFDRASARSCAISAKAGVVAQRLRARVHTLSPYHQLMMRSASFPKHDGSPGESTTSKGRSVPGSGSVDRSANRAVVSRSTTSAVTPTAFQSSAMAGASVLTQLSFARKVSASSSTPASARSFRAFSRS